MWKTSRGPSNVDNPLTRPKGAGWGDGASLELSTSSVLLDKDQWFECSSAQSRAIHCQAALLGSGRPQIHRQELSLRGRRGAARSPARPPRSRSFSTAGRGSHRHARGRPHPQGVGPGTQKPAAWAPAIDDISTYIQTGFSFGWQIPALGGACGPQGGASCNQATDVRFVRLP